MRLLKRIVKAIVAVIFLIVLTLTLTAGALWVLMQLSADHYVWYYMLYVVIVFSVIILLCNR